MIGCFNFLRTSADNSSEVKSLLKCDKVTYHYLKMKGQYLFKYPSDLEEKVHDLGY